MPYLKEDKIMVLVSFLEPWSMGANMGAPSLYETLKGYASAGWTVHYLTASKRVLGGGAHEKEVDPGIKGVIVHRFRLPCPLRYAGARIQGKADRLFLFSKYASMALSELLGQVKPRIIYAYEEAGVLATSKLRSSVDMRIPVLHRFQGTIIGGAFRHWPTLLRKYESWAALRKRADLFVMTNDGTRGDQALRHLNKLVTDGNMLFLRNGIDKSIAESELDRRTVLTELNYDPSCFYLLMVSRLAGWKRIDRGIEVVAALCARHPRIRLVVVGDGEERQALERMANDRKVGNLVFFLGALPRLEVAKLMNVCDVFLSLNDVSNCGNPLFEALLCSRPVVTLANGATSDVISDGINGRLLSPDNLDEVFSAVELLILNPNQRATLERGAREWAGRNLYTWQERMRTEVEWVEAHL